jgi:hypothetical protein
VTVEQIGAAPAALGLCDAWDDPVARTSFLGWQVRRAGVPLYWTSQQPGAGPIVVAAAHAAEALHVLLGTIGVTHDANGRGDVKTVAVQTEVLKAARDLLRAAIDNTDGVLDQVESLGL